MKYKGRYYMKLIMSDDDLIEIGKIIKIIDQMGYEEFKNEYMEQLNFKIDKLKDLLTDVINESETEILSLNRQEYLDELYHDLDKKINELTNYLN